MDFNNKIINMSLENRQDDLLIHAVLKQYMEQKIEIKHGKLQCK